MATPVVPEGWTAAVRRQWWVAALVLAASIASAALLTSRQEPLYRSSITLAVAPTSEVEGQSEVLRALDTLERRSVIATFARIPATPETLQAAAHRMGVDPATLRAYRVAASVLPSTNAIKIDVEGPDPERAAALANATAASTRSQARRLYRVFTLRTLAAAAPARAPFYPDPPRNYLVASVVGLLLGLAAALGVERLRRPRAAP